MKSLVGIIKSVLIVALVVTMILGCERKRTTQKNQEDPTSDLLYKELSDTIDGICQSGRWSVDAYCRVMNSIMADEEHDLFVSPSNARELRKYLFISSCELLETELQTLFKTSNYEVPQFKILNERRNKLNEEEIKLDNEGLQLKGTISLKVVNDMFSQYEKAKSLVASSFFQSASYSNFTFFEPSCEAVVRSIQGLSYYRDYLSNDTRISNAVNGGLKSRWDRARLEYYSSLENCIEEYYIEEKNNLDTKNTEDRKSLKRRLQEDQKKFNKMNAGNSAINKLRSFVNNF